jgi:hypothetical protein
MTLLACLGRFSSHLSFLETSFSAFGSINKQIPKRISILTRAEGSWQRQAFFGKVSEEKDNNNYTHIRFC